MKIKRSLLVLAVTALFVACYMNMNIKFDRLSRYPYEDEHTREIIAEYLDDEEIEYIIQYAIAPVYFMDYITYDGFNIFHVDQYNHTKDIAFYLSDEEIVEYTESAMKYDRGLDTIDIYGSSYHYSEILYWLENGDEYVKDATLINDPNSVIAYLNNERTMSIRHPYDLVTVDCFKNEDVLVREKLEEPLVAMCAELKNEFGGTCGGLDVERSFVNYEEQVYNYRMNKEEDLPGHSEHQLGLALDFILQNGKEFEGSKQYEWLLENAYRFGFIQTYSELNELRNNETFRPNHFRYVGDVMASKMYNNNLTLKEALK